MILAFADFELDEERRELRRSGAAVPLEPKPFAVLCHLVRHRDRVVSKQELLEAVWPDVAVGESSLGSAIWSVRRALADAGPEQRIIQTLWRRGFRFVAPVQERDVGTAPATPPAADGRRASAARAELLAKLDRALAEASAGRGRILLLVGEPGSGKTRALDTLAERAAQRSARVLASPGSAVPSARTDYGIWLPILRSAVDRLDDAVLGGRLRGAGAELARFVPALRARMPGLPEPVHGSPDARRFRLFDAVASVLREVGRDRPLVLLLDELEDADASSLRLLAFVAREIATSRILLAIALRPSALDDVPPGLEETLAELARSGGFERIPVEAPSQDARAS